MRPAGFLFFILIILLFSGCLREYSEIYIANVDVMSVSQDDGTKLTVTPYIRNDQNTDSGILSIKVKARDPSTNLIVAEKDADIGYIKSKSLASSSLTLTVPGPGVYDIEVQVFEDGSTLNGYATPVTVKATPGPGQPADIKLTDMTLEIKQFVDGSSNAVVDVSPGIYNQGGDSSPLIMEVTARESPYKAYTESDELGIVGVSNRVRGSVRFVLPRNREYTFSVRVEDSGRTAVSGSIMEKVKLNEIKYNTPMTYVLVEEGKPPVATPEEPGFLGVLAFAGILLVYSFIRIKSKR